MIRAAVLGSPISHSLSPTLHNHAYEILGIPGKYEAIEISEVEFPQFFAEATALDAKVDWRGFSLTMPLKEIVTDALTQVDPLAKRIASANTILIDRNIHEVNVKILSTDVLGFNAIFDRLTINQDSSVAIFGGGGTARAALAALDGLVNNISVYQRSEKRNDLVKNAASLSSVNFHDFNMHNEMSGYSLIVSTLPSTALEVVVAKIPTELRADQVFLDVAYSPFPSAPSIAWQKAGGVVIDGVELLVRQALEQIRLMTRTNFETDHMYEELRTHVMAVINNR
jgi:shikimate dehydrogenase